MCPLTTPFCEMVQLYQLTTGPPTKIGEPKFQTLQLDVIQMQVVQNDLKSNTPWKDWTQSYSSVGQFCDSDLEVAFQKAYLLVHDINVSDLTQEAYQDEVEKDHLAQPSTWKKQEVLPQTKSETQIWTSSYPIHMESDGPMKSRVFKGEEITFLVNRG
ncbi:hypothetical protein Tco_0475126 [Tanacetum coccineum]